MLSRRDDSLFLAQRPQKAQRKICIPARALSLCGLCANDIHAEARRREDDVKTTASLQRQSLLIR